MKILNRELKEALKDEKMAPGDYKKLISHLKKKGDKKVIKGIIKQERQHYRKLRKMKRRLNK